LQVYQYRQILARMRSGDTDRAIARSGLMDRRQVAALRRVAEHAGWLDPRTPLPNDTAVAAGLHGAEERTSWPGESDTSAGACRAQREPQGPVADAWYVAEGQRGEHLLATGQVEEAAEVFEALLVRLGNDPSYARAVVLGRLARCFYLGGRSESAIAQLQGALNVIASLAPTEGVRALHGRLHSELGEVFRAAGRYDEAGRALDAALRTAGELQDLRAQAVDLSQLGALAVARGQQEEALERYQAALALTRRIGEPLMEAAVWHRMGRVLHGQMRWQQAERHYLEAARITERHADLAATAESWNQLALLERQAGRLEAAEAWYRKVIDADQKTGNRLQLGNHLGDLAELLQDQAGRLDEARQFAEAAVSIHALLDPALPQVWRNYGVLAGILEEAATTADDRHGAELRARARDYRHLQQFAPRFLGALAQLGDKAGYARAVILGRLSRCFYMSGRSESAIARLQEALDVVASLAPSEGLAALRGRLHSELGEVLRAAGRHDEARRALGAALRIAEDSRDLRAQAVDLSQLGALARAQGRQEEALARYQAALVLARAIHEPGLEAAVCQQLATPGQPQPAPVVESGSSADTPLEITLDEEWITDYGLEGDLLVDGPRERRITRCSDEPAALDGDRPLALVPSVRTAMDSDGAVRFFVPSGEPVFERHRGCTVMRRVRREIAVSGDCALVWRLIRTMDGTRRIADVLSELSAEERTVATRVLGALTVAGAIDASGRPVGRFLHSATKKGVLPAGGLEGDEVLQLASDGDYRIYPGAPRIALSQSVPELLRAFHALTRSRRSRRDYNGRAVGREDFDALLRIACGVTGALSWGGREIKLRAYPASGALYAVEIYPVILSVESLAPGVYHYRAAEDCLEIVKDDIDRDGFLNAILPAERVMVAGAAAMICLTGRFRRHERKYGQGGYRMLVAETGHVSQNLILAATALGLSARPFGGVFDGLLNSELGLECDSEQFLLAVLVGHAGGLDER
jgi:SagB-type dehydrogenase family enzyme